MFSNKTFFLFLVLLISGCTLVPRDGDFSTVERMVNERIPQKVHWYQGGEEDEKVKEALNDLLSQPLTARAAVQVALLNNRNLQSEYETLGIAQADLVQAGLLSNPVLFASIRFPRGGAGGNNSEFDLAQEFLDILLRPARLRLARAEFERIKLRVANSVLDLAVTVQDAFHRVQGMRQLWEVLNVTAETAKASYQIAQRFDKAGNISELELAQERSGVAEIIAQLIETRAGFQATRDEMSRLLGFTGVAARNWKLASELPKLPETDPAPLIAEETALERRLELDEAKHEIAQLADALQITRDYRWIGGASVGVSTEREPDGGRVTGPNFSVEIPIFDQRQAAIARLESLLAQSQSRHDALEVEIRNEVNRAANRVSAAREIVEYYRDELIPAQEQVVKFTQQEQNYMLMDVFELLFARRQATQAYTGYINGLTEYWMARTELARASGTGLPNITESDAESSMENKPAVPEDGDSYKEHDMSADDANAHHH
jgi:outer membrane protein, heavy metal efflux system